MIVNISLLLYFFVDFSIIVELLLYKNCKSIFYGKKMCLINNFKANINDFFNNFISII